MALRRILASLFVLALALAPVRAQQASIVTPVAGPMTMTVFVQNYLNPALLSIGSSNYGTTPPANGPGNAPFTGETWLDHSVTPYVDRIYDGNGSFVARGTVDPSAHVYLLPWSSVTGAPSFGFGTVTSVICANGTVVITISGTCPERELLSANRTYYVGQDGNDACNGETNAGGSSGNCAFATLAHARAVIEGQIDSGGYNVTLQCRVSHCAYTTPLNICSWVGGGNFTFDAGGGSVLPTGAGAGGINGTCPWPGQVTVQNGTFGSNGGGTLNAGLGNILNIGASVTFNGLPSNCHIVAAFGGQINGFTPYTVNGGAGSERCAFFGGTLRIQTNITLSNPTVTITIATPGVVTLASHGYVANQPVAFKTTGALPTGLVAGTTYYVVGSSITTNTFQVSATPGGAAINTSGSQSGSQSAEPAFNAYVTASRNGNVAADGSTWTGTAVGKTFSEDTFSSIYTGTGNPNYFPGTLNSCGTTGAISAACMPNPGGYL